MQYKRFIVPLIAIVLSFSALAHAAFPPTTTGQGGTGSTTPSGILYGTNSNITPLQSVIIGNNLTFSGGTLSASGGGGGSFPFSADSNYGQVVYSTSTPTLWFKSGLFASSTSRLTYASTTAINAVTICLDGDTCRTTWPSGGGGSGTVSTSTVPTVGQLAYWTSNGFPSLLGSVATGTVSAGSSAITVTAGRSAIGGALAIDCATSGAGQNGCLSSTDWGTFNSKQATISATWPVILTGATLSFGGLSTSTAAVVGNIPYFSGVNTFANVATSSETCGSGVACTAHAVLTGGGQISLAALGSAGVLGAVTATTPTVQATSTLYGTGLGGQVLTWSGGVPAWVATSTFNSPLSFSGGAVSCSTCLTANQSITLSGVVTGTGATSITTAFGSQSAGVLGNPITGNTAVQATSTLYGTGTGGQHLVWNNGVPQWVATTTFSGLLTFANGAVTLPVTKGNFVVGNDAGTAQATSTIFISSLGLVGISSSTPIATLSIGSGTASSSASVAEYAYGASGNNATSTAATLSPRTSNTIMWPLGSSATTLTLCNFQPGDRLVVRVVNPNVTAGALTWAACSGSQLYWPNKITPTQTLTANDWDIWSFLASSSVGSSTSAIMISGSQGPAY